ncbi:MAG: Rieske (2Fe-2S) protein [Deltaproteobacteria bacterium]|nr:Rieske (2Fe-2S) protein [Deltaproteobacteria bacterium]
MITVEDPVRRTLLKRGIALMGGLLFAGLMAPAGGYFLAPLWRHSDEGWSEVGPVSAIPVGTPIKVDFVERKKDGWATTEGRASVWIVTTDGAQFTVYDPRCTHLGCPYRWDTEKGVFLCPCHTAIFDMDGHVLSGPAPRPLDRLLTKVEDGRLLIRAVTHPQET